MRTRIVITPMKRKNHKRCLHMTLINISSKIGWILVFIINNPLPLPIIPDSQFIRSRWLSLERKKANLWTTTRTKIISKVNNKTIKISKIILMHKKIIIKKKKNKNIKMKTSITIIIMIMKLGLKTMTPLNHNRNNNYQIRVSAKILTQSRI